MIKFNEDGRIFGLTVDDPAAAPGGGDPAAAAAAKPWYDGAPAEDVGYLQNRGLDKVTAREAALATAKAHREAEKLIGAPADKIIRLPNDLNDAVALREIRTRLGVPANEAGYVDAFKAIKHVDGTDLKPEEVTAWSKRALSLGLRPADALTLVNDSVKEADSGGAAAKMEREGKLAAQKSALATNWGPNMDANMFTAKQTAGALGVSPEAVAALEGVIGYDKVMDMFLKIGQKTGEDRFVANPQLGGGVGAMSVNQAQDRKTSLMSDTVWVQAYMNGDQEKAKEMLALNTIIVGGRR